MDKTTTLYFNWICSSIVDPEGDHMDYSCLLNALFSTEFIWSLPLDEPRKADGLKLREQFEEAYNKELLDFPCNLLEMLAGLSIRCEADILHNRAYGDRTSEWFWLFIENMGLLYQTDDEFDEPIVNEILWRFNYKRYEKNGRGSVGVIKDPTFNMKKLDIWGQMCRFFSEHDEYF